MASISNYSPSGIGGKQSLSIWLPRRPGGSFGSDGLWFAIVATEVHNIPDILEEGEYSSGIQAPWGDAYCLA